MLACGDSNSASYHGWGEPPLRLTEHPHEYECLMACCVIHEPTLSPATFCVTAGTAGTVCMERSVKYPLGFRLAQFNKN